MIWSTSSRIRWPEGFDGGCYPVGLPEKSIAEELLANSDQLPFPLNLHINSLMQFYFAPLSHLIELNGSCDRYPKVPTIWFSGYREMREASKWDFKKWCFVQRTTFGALLRAVALTWLAAKSLRFLILAIRVDLSKAEPKSLKLKKTKIILFRRQVHGHALKNPMYEKLIRDAEGVFFYQPEARLADRHFLAPLSKKLVFSAITTWLKYLLKSRKLTPKLTMMGKDFCLKSAYIEACLHFETFIYREQLLAIRNAVNPSQCVYSFEQVSWAAELEKKVFGPQLISHVQFGVFPYYPYPTIGVDSHFYVRSKKVLETFRQNLGARSFKKLPIALEAFAPRSQPRETKNSVVFASQPYRKHAEKHLVGMLREVVPQDQLFIKYHPRDRNLYPEIPEIKDIWALDNPVVVTRTSSLVVQLFSRGVPYLCVVDQQDAAIDTNEICEPSDPVFFNSAAAMVAALIDLDQFKNKYFDWRTDKIRQYVE